MPRLRYVLNLFAIGIILSLCAVLVRAPVAEAWLTLMARARFPDPPALPCKKQAWPNADRICLTWTAPRQATKAETGHARNDGTATLAVEQACRVGAVGRAP